MLSKIGALRQLEMQSEVIKQIKSTEFYCLILFLYTIIGSKKGICHVILNLYLLYFLSSFFFLLKKKVCETGLVRDKGKNAFLDRSNVIYVASLENIP